MTYQDNKDSPPGNSCQPAISRTNKIPKRTNARQIARRFIFPSLSADLDQAIDGTVPRSRLTE